VTRGAGEAGWERGFEGAWRKGADSC